MFYRWLEKVVLFVKYAASGRRTVIDGKVTSDRYTTMER